MDIFLNLNVEKSQLEQANRELIEKMLEKYRGQKDNPLNGKTFSEIQELAEKEFNDDVQKN